MIWQPEYQMIVKFNNFILGEAFRVQNKVKIENLIKIYSKLKEKFAHLNLIEENKPIIIAYDAKNFTIEKLSKHIRDIIHSKTYSIGNFNRLMKQNEELENENTILKETNMSQGIMIT